MKKKQRQKRSSKTLTIRLPEEQWQAKEQLTQLADKLGCSATTLIWYSIKQMLLSPPAVPPAPVTKSTRGFWVIVSLSVFRCIVGVEIKEVRERNTVKAGRYFFGYEGGKDHKHNRNHALQLAKTEAYHLLKVLGFEYQQPIFTLLDQSDNDKHE